MCTFETSSLPKWLHILLMGFWNTEIFQRFLSSSAGSHNIQDTSKPDMWCALLRFTGCGPAGRGDKMQRQFPLWCVKKPHCTALSVLEVHFFLSLVDFFFSSNSISEWKSSHRHRRWWKTCFYSWKEIPVKKYWIPSCMWHHRKTVQPTHWLTLREIAFYFRQITRM